MITRWHVKNFKSILDQDLELAPLTIFCGVNSSGKSSFLQSIAMLAQNTRKSAPTFSLNGCFLNLGEFNHVYNQTCNIEKNVDSTIDIRATIFQEESGISIFDLKYGFGISNALLIGGGKKARLKRGNIPEIISLSMENKQNEADDNGIIVNLIDSDSRINRRSNYLFPDMSNIHDVEFPEKIKKTRDDLYDFFHSKVKYLGPLRVEPKDGCIRLKFYMDVDAEGKNTAAVLDFMRGNIIKRYISPENLSTVKENNDVYFYTALEKWMIYIIFNDNNRFDYHTKVLKSGKIRIMFYLDGGNFYLNQLGNGVGWVLPILVTCLSAEPGSTIIIQEPEAHLHPKMQSRLADFFIAMSLSGRQCLIETHSEYLIEQLRYRIITMSDQIPLHEKIKLYFVNKHNGISYFDDILINEFADLSDWPENFFDESHKVKLNIMNAVVQKEEKAGKND